MSDEIDQFLIEIDRAFKMLRDQAEAEAERYNRTLPKVCPTCGGDAFVPGLPCGTCHDVTTRKAYRIVQPTEWGYEILPITGRRGRPPFAIFRLNV